MNPEDTTAAQATGITTKKLTVAFLAAGLGGTMLVAGAAGALQDDTDPVLADETSTTETQTDVDGDRPDASERLAEAVANGRITQEQADEISERIANGERPGLRQVLRGGDPSERLAEAVAEGRITQEQADEISERIANGDTEGLREELGFGNRGNRGNRIIGSEIVTDVIGIDAEALRDALQDGQSVADVATANGVDPQVVIDSLVAEANTRLQQAIDDGRITEDQVAERGIDVEQKITDRVNGVASERGDRGQRGNGPNAGPGTAPTDGAVDAPGGS